MVQRIINPLKSKSFFIFGARGTGKSTFLSEQFKCESQLTINLLLPAVEHAYAVHPDRLIEELAQMKKAPEWVVIDEVQKVPKLLDVVQYLIENKKQKFILTGSSARKLKHGSANLLAGRANVYHLFPFSALELRDNFQLDSALHWGLLPHILNLQTDREKKSYLNSYVLTYLNEEIKTEQIVRKLEPFRMFLPILGQVSGKIINHKKIADQIGVESNTIHSYFQIIEDTLLGFYLPAFHLSVRKSQRLAPKFYVFDVGVKKALEESLEQLPTPRTSVYGELFEHLVIHEIFKLNEYYEKNFRLSYYATKNATVIDLILSKGTNIF